MKTPGLRSEEVAMLQDVFRRHSEIKVVKLFGSRAKGNHATSSDIDLALWGNVTALEAESIAAELDELPLPYRYDVKPFHLIELLPLREHIERVGITVFSGDSEAN